ncbi:class I SAM-dependent methyltransferase [Frigoriflavimonas asaccharolytica]|uniref:class I SAM-dependent methyltransferase n=1 Tax=Frigoriflavimonas asaccharolytica TaxID=2735899 RepID=UPI00293BB850|nr:class I SAM-dependent methyltransferase [Frigoriflavimonas asaccharolytica]
MINSQDVFKENFLKKYPNFNSLPQVNIQDLNERGSVNTVESFLLDGGSLITDLQLLATLANRETVNSYFEIGTWRGESVHNVAKYAKDCTTLNLAEEDIIKIGLGEKYAAQHAILSKKNPEILHLTGNTSIFDFKSLNKKYDLIFIDGDHSYDMVLNDTQKVFQHLIHENTIVVWHDYAYSAQKIRYEVFEAILDGVGVDNHQYLYHPKNTMCAIFTKEKLTKSTFDKMQFPEKLFTIKLEDVEFN